MTELPDDVLELQQLAFRYFLDHTNARNGLVADNTRVDSPCSIAATGLGLSCHPIAVVNGWLKRADAAERVMTALRFFEHSPQGPEADVTGYKGFYYHFLEMKDGRRMECVIKAHTRCVRNLHTLVIRGEDGTRAQETRR